MIQQKSESKLFALIPKKGKNGLPYYSPPSAAEQVNFYCERAGELIAQKQVKPVAADEIIKYSILAINQLAIEKINELYQNDYSQYEKIVQGEDFTFFANTKILCEWIFSSQFKIAKKSGNLDMEMESCRSRWYKTIRPTLMKLGYILKIENFAVGRYGTPYDGGRGNYKITLNLKTYLWGYDYTLASASSDSDSNAAPNSGNAFLSPDTPSENLHPTDNNISNSYQNLKKGVISLESGVSIETVNDVANENQQDFLQALTKQGEKPVSNQQEKSVIFSGGAPKKSTDDTPSVSNPKTAIILAKYANVLNKIINKELLVNDFFVNNQFRIAQHKHVSSLKQRDFTYHYIQLLQYCRQKDEDTYEPAFERIKHIVTEKAKWLRKNPANWMYVPEMWLSIEKLAGATDYRYNGHGFLRGYHDAFTLQNRNKITPTLTSDLKTLFETFYPKLKEFGVSDTFLKKYCEKYTENLVLDCVRKCFARFAQGFKPTDTKGDYLRRCIRRCNVNLETEKANYQVKKAEVAQSQAGVTMPSATNTLTDARIVEIIKNAFGNDAAYFQKAQLYGLKVNCRTENEILTKAKTLLDALKLAQKENAIFEKIKLEHPSVVEAYRKDYRFAKRGNPSMSISEDDFIKEKIKTQFTNLFNQ